MVCFSSTSSTSIRTSIKSNALAVNQELVAKLQNEIALEEEMKEDEDLSANIREYLESSPFEVWNSCAYHIT
jgi:complement component 1 Q subcomponent-binding protein